MIVSDKAGYRAISKLFESFSIGCVVLCVMSDRRDVCVTHSLKKLTFLVFVRKSLARLLVAGALLVFVRGYFRTVTWN